MYREVGRKRGREGGEEGVGGGGGARVSIITYALPLAPMGFYRTVRTYSDSPIVGTSEKEALMVL